MQLQLIRAAGPNRLRQCTQPQHLLLAPQLVATAWQAARHNC
jgi:hypothetical protein